jgi:hypothetical protein
MVAFATNPTTAVAASQLDGPQRQQLAVAALASDSISELARQKGAIHSGLRFRRRFELVLVEVRGVFGVGVGCEN